MIKKIQVLKFMLIFPLYLIAVVTVIIMFGLYGIINGAIKETKKELKALTECWIDILED